MSGAYKERFVFAVKYIMAENGIDNIKNAATFLGIAYMTLYKIMDGTNSPTIEHCITICKAGKFSANWLFLNKGSKHDVEDMQYKTIMKELNLIKAEISNNRK